MTDTEKTTINLSVVDLGKIDLLVEQGFYSTRTDFIGAAIRNQLSAHTFEIQETVIRKSFAAGILAYDQGDLEDKRLKNQKLDMRVMGMLILDEDVTPELALDTIESITLRGVMKASDEVKAALADRIA